MNRTRFGGLLSFLSFIASAFFFATLMLTYQISDWSTTVVLGAAGFCLALAFVLERLGE